LKGDVKGESKRGEAPLLNILPLPLNKGKGIKGIGLIDNLASYFITENYAIIGLMNL
jgi:hypothetical protein